jgi:hypothetical protein
LKVAYGYATTSHSSQGLTTEFAVVFGSQFDQKSIYVAHSRARERTDTYVPSKEAFLSRSERTQGERLGVLEAIANAMGGQRGATHGLEIGDKVNWAYEPRGGYGYTQQIAGMVTRIGNEKVQIQVAKRNGNGWVVTTRWVKRERLTQRHGRASPEDAARVIEPEVERTEPQEELALSTIIGVHRTHMAEERQYLVVPYGERDQAKVLGAKWDWRERLWYIGPETTGEALAKWLPENVPAAPVPTGPRDEFAGVLRTLGADLTGDHPIMDGKPHRVPTLDGDRGEKSMFYGGHLDGRPVTPKTTGPGKKTGGKHRWSP